MSRHPILTFLVTTLLFSSVFYFLIIHSGHMAGGWGGYVAGLMWSPGLAALLTCKLIGRRIDTLGWNWGSGRYEAICYLIPLGYSIIIYGFVWLTGLGTFYDKDFVSKVTQSFGLGTLPAWASIAFYFVLTAVYAVIRDTATVLDEEIGWRGFLVPEFAKTHSFPVTALVPGLIWALWHYPVILFADYKSDTPVWFFVPLLTLTIPLLNFVWTWMRLKTGSIWPGVLLHASHNTFMQTFFDPLTVHNKRTNYIASEFGAGLFVLSILLATYFMKRRNEVEGDRSIQAAL
jgi:membrane protease YdiL (CAAX protease family)